MAPIFRQALVKTALLEEMQVARAEMERILGGMSQATDPAAGDELMRVLQAYLNVIRQAMTDIDARM